MRAPARRAHHPRNSYLEVKAGRFSRGDKFAKRPALTNQTSQFIPL
jgi:hypothetical protein